MKKTVHFHALACLLVYASNALLVFLCFLSPLIGLFSPRIREFFSKRKLNKDFLGKIRENRSLFKDAVVFYCSSAGEYEQARPIASSLAREGLYVHLLFFSESGFKFATLRGETLDYSLAPLDTLSNWNQFFAVLNPKVCLVVRHEMWPSFLHQASKSAKVFLINASLKSKTKFSVFIKKQLLSFFDQVFAVSEIEKNNFCETFRLPKEKVLVTGDSKYDRVLERVDILKSNIRTFSELSSQRKKLMIGSSWKADSDTVLEAFAQFKGSNINTLQVVIAPHQPTDIYLNELIQSCERLHLTYKLFSNKGDSRDTDVVIVDSIGILFELYGACDLAFVGGASHHEVHNVLEPAAFGLTLAFGPHYKNSHEASEIVGKGLAKVIHTPQECLKWIHSALHKGSDLQVSQFVQSKGGATRQILNEIHSSLR